MMDEIEDAPDVVEVLDRIAELYALGTLEALLEVELTLLSCKHNAENYPDFDDLMWCMHFQMCFMGAKPIKADNEIVGFKFGDVEYSFLNRRVQLVRVHVK